jgi:hypothetical protein
MYNTIKYLFIALTLMFLSGCLFLPYPVEEQFETPIKKNELEKIERGKTTQLEIIDRLGPPDAIARRGTIVKVPPLSPRKQGSLDVDSQDFLDLFSAKHVISQKHIVYYYETSAFHGMGAVIIVVGLSGGGGGSEQISPLRYFISRLWILIDTETGRVVDYIFRREKKKF